MDEFNLDELRGRAGATREAYYDSIKMTRALRMRLIETEFEVRRREDLIKREKPMDNKGTGKVRTYSATSALRELHHILSSALRANGLSAFNGVTMTGEWYAIDEDDAERMLAKIQKNIEVLGEVEQDLACLLDEISDVSEKDLFALQDKLTTLGSER
jgi:hypothetical protein